MRKILNGAIGSLLAVSLAAAPATMAFAKHGPHNARVRYASQSCVNPAGNMRGWCKSHAGAAFVSGTVTAINGSLATIALSNGQTVIVNDRYLMSRGAGLTVGQQVTLRGNFNGNTFFVTNPVYANYTGSGASVSGMILSVNGYSVQIVSGLRIITINDSNAAVNGSLYVGRSITANGNWNGSVFVANSIS